MANCAVESNNFNGRVRFAITITLRLIVDCPNGGMLETKVDV